MNNFVAFQNNSLFQYETKRTCMPQKQKVHMKDIFKNNLKALWCYINMFGTSPSNLSNLKQHHHMED